MKNVVAIFLFASVAGAFAEDFLADGGDPDRHPYVQCKIDLYDCIRLDKVDNWECLAQYKTCMAQMLPTAVPPVVQCQIDLYDCIRLDKVGNLECLNRYKSCLGQQLPPFVKACNQVLDQCESQASGYLEKANCYKDFALCVLNGPTVAPSDAVLDTFEDGRQMEDSDEASQQCTKDLYSCVKSGKDKKVCIKAYGACVQALVKRCSDKLMECYSAANGWSEKINCGKEYAICVRNDAPTQASTEPPTV